MIALNQINLQRGSKMLLSGADLRIHAGQKVGLVGVNGCGKTTLFKLIAGLLEPDQGDCHLPKDWRIATMSQEIDSVERTALDYVLDGDAHFRELQSALDQQSDGAKLAQLYSEFEHIGGYTASARAQTLLHGLGFQPGDDQRQVDSFSGGWRIRLNLARTLMCPSDLMLLDEPTNHLDLSTTWWLEQKLRDYDGTLLVISHDRDFLDNTVSHIAHIHNQKIQLYSGNYTSYERQKAERLAQQAAMHEKQQARVAEIERFVARFRAKATKARQAQSRLKALDRLETIAPAHVDSPFSFTLPCAEKTSQPLLQLRDASLGYGNTTLITNVELRIEAVSRIGLLGANGAGKSTLIKSLAGEIALLGGERVEGEHFALGYFNQHQLESLDLNSSAYTHILRLSPQAREQEIRNFLGGFGFQGDRAFEEISHFSGGEKARLALALIAWKRPNLLLLDEPTNHLDLEMREALTLALQTYTGAVVLISHDRHLLRNSADEFLLVNGGRIEPFDGTLEDYHQWMLTAQPTTAADANETATKKNPDRKAQRQQEAQKRNQLQPLRKQLKKLETELGRNQSKLEDIDTKLSASELYQDENKSELQSLIEEQGKLRRQVETLEEQWLELTEEYESLVDS